MKKCGSFTLTFSEASVGFFLKSKQNAPKILTAVSDVFGEVLETKA